MIKYFRECQECGHQQEALDPKLYKDSKKEAWRDLKCRKCKSIALDYGSYKEADEHTGPVE